MNTVQFVGEYTIDCGFNLEELPYIESRILDDLRGHVKSMRNVRNVRNERFFISRYNGGGKITLSVDVDFTFFGKILKLLGVIR